MRAGHYANIWRRTSCTDCSMRKSVPLLLVSLLLTACGLKGPLYLPGQKPEAAKPATAKPTPATRSEDKKNPQ